MNVYDSGRIANILQSLGYTEASSVRDADLVIFNTCHIREKAAEKVFSDLGRLNLVREERAAEGKSTIIGVVGCVVQAEDEQIWKRAPFVDFAAGPLTYHRLPEIIAQVKRRKGDSRPVEDVLEEARRLIETGSIEINLLGQNVNSYHGEDKNGKERGLDYLLRRLAEFDGLKRIRYTTSYPADMTDEIIACHHDLDKLMPYLHLPVRVKHTWPLPWPFP